MKGLRFRNDGWQTWLRGRRRKILSEGLAFLAETELNP